jgi:flagellar assembly protein FliH
LPERVVRILWHRNRIVQEKDIVPYIMPILREVMKREESEVSSDQTVEQEGSIDQTVEQIEREAYERGYKVGEGAGFAMGEQKAIVLIERLEGFIQEVAKLKKRLLNETEPQILQLAVSIARKIILRELTVDPGEIVRITREAMMRIERTGRITIKINPLLHDLFAKHKPDLLSIHHDILFDIDPSAPRHGSVVMGPVEDVVTDVDERLKDLIREMGDRLADS